VKKFNEFHGTELVKKFNEFHGTEVRINEERFVFRRTTATNVVIGGRV